MAASLMAAAAVGATRPHYGGTLRLSMRAAPASLDPADKSQPDSLAWRNVSRRIFDPLVMLDDRGRPQPALAVSWRSEPGGQRWQYYLRRGVSFSDGAPVTPEAVAASLRVASTNWKVFSSGDAVVIECDSPELKLPAELALPRYGIARRDGGKLAGSGPFAVSRWEPGKKLTLAAREDYWGGRAFVDSIEIEMNTGFREQMISLDIGKADTIEVAAEQAHRAASENRRVETSSPVELMALVFARDSASGEDRRLRQGLALSIDRAAMNEVLLQSGGEPAGGLLPNWITGYSFLFPTAVDLPRARQTRNELPQAQAWTVGYDAADPLARVLAERIVLNAGDAGITLQLTGSAGADAQLARLPLPSLDAQVSLTALAAGVGLPRPKFTSDSASDLYAAENALLQTQRVIPLLYLRTAKAVGPNVRNWWQGPDGNVHLEDTWLATEKP